MYLFIEKVLRGGKRHRKANNKHMKNYDPEKPSIFIYTYLDMNNLHGCGMRDYLPYGAFKWLKMLIILM